MSGEKMLVHLGHGGRIIKGWHNYDQGQIDITRSLPFESATIDALFLEHVIEHVTVKEAYLFFVEAMRVLKNGGVMRLAFPDVVKIYDNKLYEDYLKQKGWADGTRGCGVKSTIFNHRHRMIWTTGTISVVLQSVGFRVTPHEAGESVRSVFQDIEQHWKAAGREINSCQTSCVEAEKQVAPLEENGD